MKLKVRIPTKITYGEIKPNRMDLNTQGEGFEPINDYLEGIDNLKYSVRRLIGSLWADIKAITITE